MTIDCCGLACPEPVLRTKKALEELPEDSVLDVLVDQESSVANVRRFAEKSGYTCESEALGEGRTRLSIVKGFACTLSDTGEPGEAFYDKTLLIKDDKVGEGELGGILMHGFLKTTLEFDRLPRNIILINRGVFLTTDAERYGEIITILKRLEERGVRIYSCGLCMNHFGIDASELKVGEIGNAYDTMQMLLETDAVSL
jgi:selenium metabolism protein YedF